MHRVHWLFCLDTLLVGLPSTVSVLDDGYSRNVSSVLNCIGNIHFVIKASDKCIKYIFVFVHIGGKVQDHMY